MFNVTARTSGKSAPRCQNARIDSALLTPFHSCGNESPLHGTLTAEPVAIVSSSFNLLNPRTGSTLGASSFTNVLVSSALDSPISLSTRPRSFDSRPESEIQISSIVDVVSFLRSRCSDAETGSSKRRRDFANLAVSKRRASRSILLRDRRVSHADCRGST